MMETLFVYGTLRPRREDGSAEDARFYPLIEPWVRAAAPARLDGAVLYDLGAFPAARPGKGVVKGDVLWVDEEALVETDRIEGHPDFFRRERVRVRVNGREEEAWVYWAPENLVQGRSQIAGGDWFARRSNPVGEEETPEAEETDPVLSGLVARFAESECSWLSTVRPNGRPHSAPVWHVWRRGRAYVVTTAKAVKRANIAANPAVVITHPDPINPIIIEGWAIEAPALEAQLQPLFKAKYDWDIVADKDYNVILEITPLKLMAWGERGEGRWPAEAIMKVRLDHERGQE